MVIKKKKFLKFLKKSDDKIKIKQISQSLGIKEKTLKKTIKSVRKPKNIKTMIESGLVPGEEIDLEKASEYYKTSKENLLKLIYGFDASNEKLIENKKFIKDYQIISYYLEKEEIAAPPQRILATISIKEKLNNEIIPILADKISEYIEKCEIDSNLFHSTIFSIETFNNFYPNVVNKIKKILGNNNFDNLTSETQMMLIKRIATTKIHDKTARSVKRENKISQSERNKITIDFSKIINNYYYLGRKYIEKIFDLAYDSLIKLKIEYKENEKNLLFQEQILGNIAIIIRDIFPEINPNVRSIRESIVNGQTNSVISSILVNIFSEAIGFNIIRFAITDIDGYSPHFFTFVKLSNGKYISVDAIPYFRSKYERLYSLTGKQISFDDNELFSKEGNYFRLNPIVNINNIHVDRNRKFRLLPEDKKKVIMDYMLKKEKK